MSKNLVIVESPAKAKTIEKYLGKDFTVLSSVGHIRSIVKKTKGRYAADEYKNRLKNYLRNRSGKEKSCHRTKEAGKSRRRRECLARNR